MPFELRNKPIKKGKHKFAESEFCKELCDEWKAYALKAGDKNPEATFDYFRFYWVEGDGLNTRDPSKRDWTATWKTWIRRNTSRFQRQSEPTKSDNSFMTQEAKNRTRTKPTVVEDSKAMLLMSEFCARSRLGLN